VCSLQQCRRELQVLHVLYAIERLRFDCMTRPRPRSARVRGLVVVLGPLLSKKSNRTNSALLRHRPPLSPTGTICVPFSHPSTF